jgi:hypothetical protein
VGRTHGSFRRSAALPLAALALSGCAALAHSKEDPARVVRGPIPSRTQEPIKLTFLSLRPRRAATQPEKTTSLLVQEAYSNLFQNGNEPSGSVVFDGEISRTSLALRRALTDRTDIEVEIAAVYATAGFMDAIIEGYHAMLGLPNENRDERPRNAYEMKVEKDGVVAYELEGDDVGFADIPVIVTHALVVETPSSPAVSVRAGIELPTGSEAKGFGNGAFDFGTGVLAEKSFGRWSTTGAVDYTWPGTSDSFERAGMSPHDGFDVQLGVEYRWNDRLSLLLGAVLESPVTRDLLVKQIDEEILSIDVGCAWDLSDRSRLLLGFEEDAIANDGPDISLFAGFGLQL